MDNIKIDRKTITIDILKEVNSLPFEYLKTLYAMVHSFRVNLPSKNIALEKKENFNWDNLIEEININRKSNNERMFKNL